MLAKQQGCFWGPDPGPPPSNSMRYRVRSPLLLFNRVTPVTCAEKCAELNYKYIALYVSPVSTSGSRRDPLDPRIFQNHAVFRQV